MKKRTILVVDDSMVMRLKIEDTLNELDNIEILQAKDGLEALEIIGENTVDGLILDSLMPKLDELGVLEELKRLGSQIKVIVLTADIQATTEQKFVALGAKDVLHKPFSKNELLQSVRSNIGVQNQN